MQCFIIIIIIIIKLIKTSQFHDKAGNDTPKILILCLLDRASSW